MVPRVSYNFVSFAEDRLQQRGFFIFIHSQKHGTQARRKDLFMQGYEKYTNQEMHEMGVNDSSIHVDFMIGTKDLSIVGIKRDGGEFPIFVDGLWAF